MEVIIPGVYDLPLKWHIGGSTRLIHPTAVETETGLILIDTGIPEHVEPIMAQLEEEGFGQDDVELITITHQDFDHAGALHDIAERTGATVLAHTDDAPYIAGEKTLLKSELGEYPFVPVDVELVDGVTFHTASGKMQVVATPGHTPGHISLYIPEKQLLIAGDAITAVEAFDGPSVEHTPDMDTAIRSVNRLAELHIERTFCFHGGLVEHTPQTIQNMYESLRDER